jgi:hypothetical protein
MRRGIEIEIVAGAILLFASGPAVAQLERGGFFPKTLTLRGVRPPGPARARVGLPLAGQGRGLIDLSQWPAEPSTPKKIDAERLTDAFVQLSVRPVPRPVLRRYVGWMLQYGQEFGVDPFLLAALAHDQSRLRPRKHTIYGVGLVAIDPAMHGPRIREGQYRYRVLEGDVWVPRRLAINRFPFTVNSLLRPEHNIYFAAAILSIFSQQCPDIDRYFGSVPHRHAVSHFLWGDRVLGAGLEDRVLRERRRLFGYYLRFPPLPRGRFKSLPLYCPLDGAPRKITGVMGDDREGGRRRHTGIDFDSTLGEPVRAIAPGKVTLAGVDWGRHELESLEPQLARMLPPGALGPRGLLVMIDHREGLSSSYMHLSAYTVRAGDKVQAGQLIGYVGRSGIKESPAHLHLDMRHEGQFIDPMEHLAAYLFHPAATYFGRRKAAAQRHQRLLRWKARRRAILRRLRDRRTLAH